MHSQAHLQKSVSELRGSGASVKVSCKDFDSCLPHFQDELGEADANMWAQMDGNILANILRINYR